MDTTTTLPQGLQSAYDAVSTLLGTARALIVHANEEAPTSPTVGTVDEAQAEVLTNLELALRHLEDARSRFEEASHAFGQVPTGTATAGLSAANDSADEAKSA